MRSPTRAPALLAGVLALAACAGPPRTDSAPRRTVLATESDDARAGRREAAQAEAELGLLDAPALVAYVGGIGDKLVRGLPRRSFAYRFGVVDQVEPNAFALPGGHVFVSRGLLLLANSEDELACVLGHEITHAASRHAARQEALARSGNPLALPWNRAAQQAAYERDMERQADEGGQILCAAAGYDPRALSRFLVTLLQAERLRAGYSRSPGFFDTHPGSQERASAAVVRASEIRWRRDPTLGDTREALLRHLEGLAVGQRPEAGIFEGELFLHPDLDFQIRFPRGWRTSNTNRMVGASSPRGDGLVYLVGEPPTATGREAADAWLEKAQQEQPLEVRESKRVQVGRFEAWRMRLEAGDRRGSIDSYVTFVPYGPHTFRITGAAPAWASAALEPTLATARSFAPLGQAERRSIQARRLHVVTARPGEDLAALGRRTGNAWDVETTAVHNGVFANHRFEGAERVKIAEVAPYRPGAPTAATPPARAAASRAPASAAASP